MVWYENVEALQADGLVLHREVDPDRADGGLITVRKVTKGSLAAFHDVVPEDRIEDVFTEARITKKLRRIMEELVAVANAGMAREKIQFRGHLVPIEFCDDSFPIAIEFRGPALKEILKEGTAALRNLQKMKQREIAKQKQREKEAAAENVDAGAKVVLVRQSRAWEPEHAPPKRKDNTHSIVLPTLLVRENQKDPPVFCHPLTPVYEARAAASRAAERVAVARRCKSVANLRSRSKEPGQKLCSSVSLPSLVPADPVLAALEKGAPSPKGPCSPTFSRRHWLPEPVKVSKADTRKAPRLSIRSLEKVSEAKKEPASCGALSMKMEMMFEDAGSLHLE